MQIIDTACRFVQRHAVWFWAAALFIGLAFQELAHLIRPVVFPLAVMTMMMTMTRVDWMDVLVFARRPGLWLTIGLMTMVIAPIGIWGLLEIIGVSGAPATGIVLVAAAPPLLSSLTYSIFLGLEGALAVTVSVPLNLISPLVLPFLLIEILGLDLTLSLETLTWRLALMIGLSFGGAWVIRRLKPAISRASHAHYTESAMVLFMTTFGIGVMDGVVAVIAAEPLKVFTFALIAVGINAGLQLFGIVVTWRLGRKIALTSGLVVGCRNVMLVIGAVATTVQPDLMLYLVVSQLPLYVFPALQRPICGWLLRDT